MGVQGFKTWGSDGCFIWWVHSALLRSRGANDEMAFANHLPLHFLHVTGSFNGTIGYSHQQRGKYPFLRKLQLYS
ncbi:unnamed protein product [Hymenolepis diminuta]|uniref:Uncharacterized protein n=1 Tax=Hymenolepis diminuta TaxID=6216 RepID=A0A564YVJ8_HYMDI|nr:unnamed protein product [Hymenolepis diminuta]